MATPDKDALAAGPWISRRISNASVRVQPSAGRSQTPSGSSQMEATSLGLIQRGDGLGLTQTRDASSKRETTNMAHLRRGSQDTTRSGSVR